MVEPPYPITGRSNGMPIRVDGRPGTGRRLPPLSSNEQPKLTSTFSFGRAISQGSGERSQLSGISCCHPFWIDCLKMPYSYRSPYPIAGSCNGRGGFNEACGQTSKPAVA